MANILLRKSLLLPILVLVMSAASPYGGGAGDPAPEALEAVTLIALGDVWQYAKGTVEPPATWNTIGFDDSAWLGGATGIGYGDADDATVLGDMQNGYWSVYARREFTIADPGTIANLELTIDYDDGFVAYINGAEIARRGLAGTPPAYSTAANPAREAGAPETIALGPLTGVLVAGTNVLAIQIHNTSLGSSDLSLRPSLTSTNPPPAAPTNPLPADGATGVPALANLCVNVSDPQGEPLDVTFRGRQVVGQPTEPFTIVVLPDTQYYSRDYPATYLAQTSWIVSQRAARNIAFVAQLGDITNDGDSQPYQWTNADAAFDLLEDPQTTTLPDGIPYGVAIGNHDQTPIGTAGTLADEGATTTLFNQTFGVSRFAGRGYYGGHYGVNNDNHYELFSASGMDFIVIYLEYDQTAAALRDATLAWADGLLLANPGRRAIIVSHWIISPDASFSNQGSAIYEKFKDNPNVFLMLCGHLDTANRRADVFNGNTIHTLLSDYQTQAGGGNGWLRLLTFSPDSNEIHVQTYSPTLDQSWTTAANDFTLTYAMDSGLPFEVVGTASGVASGGQACVEWPGRLADAQYQWYAEVSDGSSSTVGSRYTFSTTGHCISSVDCDDGDPCTSDICSIGGLCTYDPAPNCCVTAADCGDGNPCTDEACDVVPPATTGTCQVTNNTGPCSDNDACTTGDSCAGGLCAGTELDCDDANGCTADACVGGACESLYQPAPGCCTQGTHCDDGDACTIDSCDAGSCVNAPDASCCSSAADCDDGNACTADSCATPNAAALSFDGVDDGVSMGVAAALGSTQFTVEFWAQRTGTGATANTGTGGFFGVPLVTKGVGEADADSRDMNFFVGINDAAGGVIAADFEEGSGQPSPGLNHPVYGSTSLTTGVWTHVAVTYDGTTWNVYLNGILDGTASPGVLPRADSIQHFGLGTALTSTGAASGRFAGILDEVRVWNRALTEAEIRSGMNAEIASAPGLSGRWALDEGSGAIAADSSGSALDGALSGAPYWVASQLPALGTGACAHDPIAGCCGGNLDCDDGNACTANVCSGSVCTYPFAPVAGCCAAAADCDDADACTADSCDGTSSCVNQPDPACCDDDADCDDALACTLDYCPAAANAAALSLNGAGDRIVMGAAAGLGSATFTVETWFRWNGGGATTNTGTGGVIAYPLVAKGRGEAEGSTVDMNYFLGIRASDGVLAADFEEGGSGASPGLNHPVLGATAVSTGAWHHAAATYDGTCWEVYLDGQLDTAGAACPGQPPRADSIQHFGLGTGLNSSGVSEGYFNGSLDEARVWGRALSEGEIQAGMNRAILADADLLGRWGLDEGAGVSVADSTGNGWAGTITGGTWVTTDLRDFGTPSVCEHAPVAACCDTAADCDDGNLCTADACAANACEHAPIAGCCLSDADCGDGNSCTTDACVANVCENTADPDCCLSDADCGDGNACSTDACILANAAMLSFDGSNDYVTMGAAPALGASRFTLETWLRWTGAGAGVSTGSGGITAIPLITKGRGEGDGSNLDMNYFLGISTTGGVLAADFEEAAGQASPGLNHPVAGVTAITPDVWHHAAVTYDGACWQLYLDGAPDGPASCPGRLPRADSIQHFGLGTAMTSTGVAAGFFAGDLDEVRVWDRALTATELQAGMGEQIPAGAGLLGRWGLNEGSGMSAGNSVAGGPAGALTGGPVWESMELPDFGTNECGHAPIEGCCLSDGECGDGDVCTADLCVANACTHPPSGVCCATAADCEDANACTADACTIVNPAALNLDGTNDYVTMGSAAATLGASQFTLECWFNWGTGGATVSTGTGGLAAAYPLVTRGRGEAENSTLDMNYFLGINLTGSVLAADFEEGAGQASPGLNHPVAGATAVTPNVWHHAAVTYDGTCWQLYLDGNPDGAANCPGRLPRADSIQHFGVGTAMNSTGVAAGFFKGRIDEARVWNRALTAGEIQASWNAQLTSGAGLLGRWGFDEGSGATAGSSVPGSPAGTFMNGALWAAPGANVFGPDLCAHQPIDTGQTTCGIGACQVTMDNCVDGQPQPCVPGAAEPEICDGIDNDCDGPADQGFPNTDGDAAADCVDPDDDNDLVLDGPDCAPLDSGASSGPPAELAGLEWTAAAPHLLVWQEQGTGVLYDVAGGLVSALAAGGGVTDAACLGDGLAAAGFDDTRAGPASRGIYYYLARAQKAGCGSGTYGTASGGAERIPAAACP